MPTSHTFIDLLLEKAANRPDKLFARHPTGDISFARLENASAILAQKLCKNGIGPKDRVAVMMRNSPAALAVIYAVTRCGATWIPVNTALKGAGLEYIISHSQPALIVADSEYCSVITDCGAAQLPAIIEIDSPAMPAYEASVQFEAVLPTADDIAAIMYTSGTTGPAKGVLVTHRMLRLAAEAVAVCSDAKDDDDFYMWEPFFHIGGAQVLLLPLVRNVTLTISDRFSASRFWDELRQAGSTHIHHLGGIIQILLKQPPSEKDHDHNVRIAWGGGCATEVWQAFEERFGIQIRECYGMTEASSLTTFNDSGIVGSVGHPVPWFTVKLVDEHGAVVTEGKGEIVVTTSIEGAIFPGYYRNPEATAKALRADGFFTGDLGSWGEDGNLFFHGRMTDSVRCKGENVSAWEVEHVAADHPDVEDCAMIGVAAEIGEQDIKLFVQPKIGSAPKAGALNDWLKSRLAHYQLPRYIAFVDTFERTPSQRIMKHKLPKSHDDCWDRLNQ
ncbi:class I adenylate-forming enzyme family protein [Ochrobactrum quorumnocens]|uniref:ATP-dependent acyl-CoA ligase n=1 Tax=Ochrobactrum quorumnocens TaxID=271865 RepID=A0A5N1JUP4_9HYPH|nr:AMP-binding protein [[Ochrobactrum] quorumnocens]KAA9366968.1 ATP-dependent acyl-CoA ligase [[Ochrobactrum] quorumnocens]MBD7989244.1 AMP-binding protein [Ochrobactrum gallinarum]